MFRFVSSERLQGLMRRDRGWMLFVFLPLVVSGTHSMVTVHQPPVVSAALGSDVIMPCHVKTSQRKLLNTSVLYWLYTSNPDEPKLWPDPTKYVGRVEALEGKMSSNKSILFRNVQWKDSGKYLCKLSIRPNKTMGLREKGNETYLMLYDSMVFNLTNHNDSRLQCEVNVSRGPESVLSVTHDGCRLASVSSPVEAGAHRSPYVTLVQSVSVAGDGKYECELRVNEELVTNGVFLYRGAGEAVVGGRNISTTCATELSRVMVVFPEPWFLYVALLLVPITFLLGLLTARVMCNS